MTKIVFDASAVLALLQQEKGAEVAEQYLPNATISAVNFSEVVTVLTDIGMPILEAEETTVGIMKNVFAFDTQQAIIAADFRKITKSLGLSFGDRACLALAKQKNWPVLTADKAWGKLDHGIKIILIR